MGPKIIYLVSLVVCALSMAYACKKDWDAGYDITLGTVLLYLFLSLMPTINTAVFVYLAVMFFFEHVKGIIIFRGKGKK